MLATNYALTSTTVTRFFLTAMMCSILASSCEATLVVAVPNQEGMLIVSDRLGHDTFGGYADDLKKVVSVNPHTAIAVTGSAIFSTRERTTTNIVKHRLDTWDLVKAYFSTNALEFNKQHFADCMSEQLSNHLVRIQFKLPSSEPTGTQFIVFRTTPRRECLTSIVLLMLTPSDSGVKISTQCQESLQPDGAPAQMFAFGHAELPLELRQGNDPRFDGLRNDAVIAGFLAKPPQIKNVKLGNAQIFARKLMTEAAANTELLKPYSIIGTNLDETILRFK